MVRFIKRLLRLLTPRRYRWRLGYNLAELQDQLGSTALRLSASRSEDGFKALKRAVEIERNIQILHIYKLQTPDSQKLAYQQGRLSALENLLVFIEDCENPEIAKGLREAAKNDSQKQNIRQLRRRGTSETVL